MVSADSVFFDNFVRTDESKGRSTESTFDFLNRSARPVAATVRQKIDEWGSNFPENEQLQLGQRLRHDFPSTFFELLLHELFQRLGAQLEPHPKIQNTSKRPDFLATWADSCRLLIEATLFVGEDEVDKSWEAVYDAINAEHFPCHLCIRKATAPRGVQPSIRRIIAFLRREIRTIERSGRSQAFDTGPVIEFRDGIDGETRVEFALVGKSNPDAQTQSIGTYPPQYRWGDCVEAIRDDLHEKAKRYGKPADPYVIALNSQSPWVNFPRDTEMALLGTVQESWNVQQKVLLTEVKGDGLWGNSTTPKYTRLSGVLLTDVTCFSVGRAAVITYVNDHATHPFPVKSWPFAIAHCRDTIVERIPGSALLAEVLELDRDWPGDLWE